MIYSLGSVRELELLNTTIAGVKRRSFSPSVYHEKLSILEHKHMTINYKIKVRIRLGLAKLSFTFNLFQSASMAHALVAWAILFQCYEYSSLVIRIRC